MDFLNEVEKKLDLPSAEKVQVMRELRSHYCELRDEFVESGMDAVQAEQEAAKRLGEPGDIASRLQTVHCRATWKTALLTALPFLISFPMFFIGLPLYGKKAGPSFQQLFHHIMSIQQVIGLCLGIFLLAVCIREFKNDRRPIWLATWLGFGIIGIMGIQPQNLLGMALLFTLIPGVIAVWAFRQSTYWRNILAGWTIIAVGIIAMKYLNSDISNSESGMMLLFHIPLMMAIALRVFARHPYGSTAQASLFLFTFYQIMPPYSRAQDMWINMVLALLPMIITIAIVLIYARAATWQHKLIILSVGILLIGTPSALSYGIIAGPPDQGYSGFRAAFSAAMTLIKIVWVVFIPLLFQRFRPGGDRPELAR